LALDENLRERVLAEIDGGVGTDGREDEGAIGETFRELRFQRKAVFRAEQKAAMGEEVGGDEAWSWEAMLEISRDYLIENGKDLEVAAIMVEAATRVDGLEGLVGATEVVADLVERYWERGLYPPEDEDDGVEARFHPLSGLSGGGSDKDGTLIGPVRRMVVAGDPTRGELSYFERAMADTQLSTAASASADKRKALTEEAEAALAAIEATVRKLPRSQVDRAAERVAAAEAAWRRAIGFISERTKPRFPAASKLSGELSSIGEWLRNLAKLLPEDMPVPEAEEAAADGAEGAADATGAPVAGGGAGGARAPFSIGQMSTREDALRAVRAAAAFFEAHEPVSPLGAALREVDRRARLSFADLLAELIPDEAPRTNYYWRSGVKPPEPETA